MIRSIEHITLSGENVTSTLGLPAGRQIALWRERKTLAQRHNERRKSRSTWLLFLRTLVGCERIGRTAVLYR